jgi:tyrosinase
MTRSFGWFVEGSDHFLHRLGVLAHGPEYSGKSGMRLIRTFDN